jgi:hypothetical protein
MSASPASSTLLPSVVCPLSSLLAALLGLGCSSDSGGAASGAWGKADDGYQAMLFAPRGLVKVGEAIELRVRVRNQVGEIRYFASAHDLLLKVARGENDLGADVDYVALAKEGIKMSPGQELDFPLRRYATAGPEAKLCQGEGLYRFRGRLGKLELPPVVVRVEP